MSGSLCDHGLTDVALIVGEQSEAEWIRSASPTGCRRPSTYLRYSLLVLCNAATGSEAKEWPT